MYLLCVPELCMMNGNIFLFVRDGSNVPSSAARGEGE